MHVKVTESIDGAEDEEVIEIPVETEGHILMSTLRSYFTNACGLKFKTAQSTWRGVRVIDEKLLPAVGEFWNERLVYVVTFPKVQEPTKGREIEVYDPITSRTYPVVVGPTNMVSVDAFPFRFEGKGVKAKSRKTGKVSYFKLLKATTGSFVEFPLDHYAFEVYLSMIVEALKYWLALTHFYLVLLLGGGLYFMTQAGFEFPLYDIEYTNTTLNCTGSINQTTCLFNKTKTPYPKLLIMGVALIILLAIIILLVLLASIRAVFGRYFEERIKTFIYRVCSEADYKPSSSDQGHENPDGADQGYENPDRADQGHENPDGAREVEIKVTGV